MNERLIQPIPTSELERRWAAARSLMRARNIDALVMQNSNDWLGGYVRWFTGLPANNAYPRAVIFPIEGGMTVVEQGPFGGAKMPGPDDQSNRGVAHILTTPSYVSANYTADYDARIVADQLAASGFRVIGWVNPSAAYFGFGKALEHYAANLSFVDLTEEIDLLKAIKSDEEWALIAKTTALQDAAMAEVVKYIKPGMHDFEVAAYAQYQTTLRGAEQGIYLSSSSPSGRAAVFRPPYERGRKIEAGDAFALLLETNGPGGYYTEIGRTIVLGQATPALKKAVADAIAAQARTLDRLKPGARCADILAAHNADMVALGFPPERRLYAHGMGYDMVERPLIRDDETMTIAEGMSIVVHPGYVTPEANALVCDNYRIGADGVEACLHKTPKEIFELG